MKLNNKLLITALAFFVFFEASGQVKDSTQKTKDATQKVKDTTPKVKDTTQKVKDTTQKAKDTTDLMSALEKDVSDNNTINYTTATFKTTRLINGHTVQNVGAGVLDVKISHRFGTIGGDNGGAYNLFGLDKATMRMGLDYGITPYLMVGVGRSTYFKTFDGFFKLRILRQSTGKRNMPITLSYVPTIAVQTLKPPSDRKNYYSSKLSFSHQLIIGRKFSESTSLQLMPSFIHKNLTLLAKDPNDFFSVGIGGRQKLSKRVSINFEYYYLPSRYKLSEIVDSSGTVIRKGSVNSFSIGFDIETGGHVFQLHFTNSIAMNESSFITETTDRWNKGEISFGFNISRVFTIVKPANKPR